MSATDHQYGDVVTATDRGDELISRPPHHQVGDVDDDRAKYRGRINIGSSALVVHLGIK